MLMRTRSVASVDAKVVKRSTERMVILNKYKWSRVGAMRMFPGVNPSKIANRLFSSNNLSDRFSKVETQHISIAKLGLLDSVAHLFALDYRKLLNKSQIFQLATSRGFGIRQ